MADLTDEQSVLLNKLYYKDGMIVGRDKLFQYVRDKHPDIKLPRRKIAEWLSFQEITQLHKKHEEPKNIKSTILKAPHAQLGIDLVDMQLFEKRGYKYLLNGVDLFSRKIYSVPLLNKEDETVLAGFKKIRAKIPDLKSIRSDRGSEFISKSMEKYLKDQGIKQVLSSAYAPQSNGAIERANQTLKRLIHKNIEINPKFDWTKSIGKMTKIMNETEIDKMGASANEIEAEKNNTAFLKEIVEKDREKKTASLLKPPLKVGGHVRVYDPTNKMKSRVWSKDVHVIEKVFKPKTAFGVYEYQLKGSTKRHKQEDLQLIPGVANKLKEEEQFEVSKIVKRVMIDGEPHYRVKWKGYRKASDDTVEPRASLLQDIPKMLHAFEKANKIAN